ncbi:MAG: hypothetical protein GWO23_17080 [Gammaproteobacteria bacterium]|nr:hypothetical protein [Gammaproteobacteria bacterium]
MNAQIAVGYAENHGVGNSITSDNLQIQAGFMDNAGSGLFGSVAYQREETDVVGTDSTDAYWIKAGIKRAFNSLGDTSIAGQFGMYNDQFFNISVAGGGAAATFNGSEVTRYGVEVVQYFGSAFQAYVVWETLDVEADLIAGGTADADEIYNVRVGGVVFF